MALTDKLTAIADATRAKTGTTNQMTLDEIATAINGISSTKGIEMTQMGYTSTSGYTTVPINLSIFDTSYVVYLIYTISVKNSSNWYSNFVTVNCANGKITPVQWGTTSSTWSSPAYDITYTLSGTKLTIKFPSTVLFNTKGSSATSSTSVPLYMIGVKK